MDNVIEVTEAEVLRFLLQRGDAPTIELAIEALLEHRKNVLIERERINNLQK